MSFIPYLNFDGQCAEAIQFYAEVFGADEVQIMRFSDAPEEEGLPQSDRVMYSHIMIGDKCLMASDSPPGLTQPPQESVSVHYPVPDLATGQAVFEALAHQGTITMAFEPTFFAPGFGMVRDRFGTSWMIGVHPEDDAS